MYRVSCNLKFFPVPLILKSRFFSSKFSSPSPLPHRIFFPRALILYTIYSLFPRYILPRSLDISFPSSQIDILPNTNRISLNHLNPNILPYLFDLLDDLLRHLPELTQRGHTLPHPFVYHLKKKKCYCRLLALQVGAYRAPFCNLKLNPKNLRNLKQGRTSSIEAGEKRFSLI